MNPVIATIRKLDGLEKKTFSVHLAYQLIEGFLTGVLALNEFIFIKSLKGSSYQLSILFMSSIILLLLSLFFNEYLKRFNNKRRLLIVVGLITRLPLLILLLFPAVFRDQAQLEMFHLIFLAIFFVYYIAQPIVMPIIIQYLKSNYRNENFSKLYSYTTMAKQLVMLVVTFLFGLLLDFDHFSFRYVYAAIGALGVVSIHLLSTISPKNLEPGTGHLNIGMTFIKTWKDLVRIIRSNKQFRDFEAGFMFYGFSFMITAVLLNLFYDRVLLLNYSSTAFYKNVYYIIAIITLPTFGRLMGKMRLDTFAIMTYGFMLLMILFTALTEFFPGGMDWLGIKIFWMMLIANFSYGLFAGTMPLLWDIGSTYFCHEKETDTYQAIHMSLTGLRGLLAPFLGIFIYEKTSFIFTFIVAMLFLVAAIIYVRVNGKSIQAATHLKDENT